MADPLKLFSMMNLSSPWRGIMLEPDAGFPVDGDLYAPEYYFAGSLTPVVVTFVPPPEGIRVGYPMPRVVGFGMYNSRRPSMDIGLPEAGVQKGTDSINIGAAPHIQSGIHLVPKERKPGKPDEPGGLGDLPSPFMPDIGPPRRSDIVDDSLIIYLEERLAILQHDLTAEIRKVNLETEQVLLTKIAELHSTLDHVWYKRLYRWVKGLFNAV